MLVTIHSIFTAVSMWIGAAFIFGISAFVVGLLLYYVFVRIMYWIEDIDYEA